MVATRNIDENAAAKTALRASLGVIKPFIFIAANNASSAEKEMADYVCDGIDDHIQIQAALDAFGDVGGTIMLSAGTFNVDAMFPPDYVTIEGAGPGKTILKGQVSNVSRSIFHRTSNNVAGYEHLETSIDAPVTGVEIRNIEIDGSLMPISGAIQISSITGNGTIVTVTTGTAHGYSSDEYVVILDTVNYTTNKFKTVQITVIDTTSFSYASTETGEETIGQVVKPYNTNGGAKAIFFMWLKDCIFENIYAHHTPSTVFGTDNHQNCKYINCRAEFGGRAVKLEKNGLGQTTGRPSGCSGFGLGVSGYDEENLQVVGCTAKYNWNAGFVFETVNDGVNDKTTSYLRFESCLSFGNTYNFKIEDGLSRQSQSSLIVNCYAREAVVNKVSTFANPAGEDLSDSGIGYVLMSNVSMINISGCISAYNEKYGIYNDHRHANYISIDGCQVYGNKDIGVFLRGNKIILKGNHINNNDAHGIRLRVAAGGMSDIIIEGNHILDNGRVYSVLDTGIDIKCDEQVIDSVIINANRIGNTLIENVPISSIVGDGSIVTVSVFPTEHKLFTGDKIIIAGTTNFNASGKFITVESPSSFTYIDTPVATESTGTIAKVNTQDYPIVITDDAKITNVLIVNNIMTESLRTMASSYVNAGVTKANNLE